MQHLADAVAEIDRALASALHPAFADDTIRGLADNDLLEVIAAAASIVRRSEALLIEAAGEVHERGQRGPHEERITTRMGSRNANELLQRATRASARTVAGYLRASSGIRRDVAPSSGEQLPAPFPAMREALVDGVVGVDSVLAVENALRTVVCASGRAALEVADESLAAAARSTDGPIVGADDLRALAQVWAVALDQDGAEPVESRALRKRGVTLGVAHDGLVPIRGNLMIDTAAQLQRIFDALINPKGDGPDAPARPWFEPTDDHAARDEVHRDDTSARTHPSFLDEDAVLERTAEIRTRPQLQHDALANALAVAARSGELPTIGGAAPTLVVSVRAEDLSAGTGFAHIPGVDEPVSLALARHTACGGTTQKVVFDERGRIVSLHTTDRVFTAHQRRAITLRDGGCIIPGCHVPASWCEIHHVTEHAKGGPTHTDNGTLLCYHHHRHLDTQGWRVRMNHGTPEIRGPHWWDPHGRWRPTSKSPTRQLDRIHRRT